MIYWSKHGYFKVGPATKLYSEPLHSSILSKVPNVLVFIRRFSKILDQLFFFAVICTKFKLLIISCQPINEFLVQENWRNKKNKKGTSRLRERLVAVLHLQHSTTTEHVVILWSSVCCCSLQGKRTEIQETILKTCWNSYRPIAVAPMGQEHCSNCLFRHWDSQADR